MPIDRNSDPGDISLHNHSGDCKEDISGKYAEYIEAHRDALVTKCDRINNCIEGLLKDENVLSLLKGDNLSLNKTCGLITENSFENDVQNGKCTSEDRKDIRQDLEEHLKLQLEDSKASGWNKVKGCLTNRFGDKDRTTYVNDICRLAYKEPQICVNHKNIHKNVTDFFNNQIQNLQCTCRNLQKSEGSQNSAPLSAVIGGLVGGFFLLLAISAVIFFLYRRKSKRSKKQKPNVIYLPAPNADNYPVYQELDDKNYQGYGKFPTGNPPALPMRYATHLTGHEDEPAYLEPVEAGFRLRPQNPVPGAMNPCYGAPPEYSERDADNRNMALGTADVDNGYFQPLPSPPKDNGFDKSKNVPEDASGYETVESALLSKSTEEAPKPGSVRVAPIPVKRSGGDRQGLPSYVVLEQDRGSKSIDTQV